MPTLLRDVGMAPKIHPEYTQLPPSMRHLSGRAMVRDAGGLRRGRERKAGGRGLEGTDDLGRIAYNSTRQGERTVAILSS